ncbi:MAG: type I restriction enzyme HsdR N-terminal domain-containing protein [Bacteroidaceae bacterium]|nr:type I restriction enzyme HsdR N-terminal domain-containing protein [Bacteroidaceae bacterium]
MQALNLPRTELKIVRKGGRLAVFDTLRQRFVALTPEEWVRQHFVRFLQQYRQFPAGAMANEVTVELNGMRKRCDTLVYGRHAEPLMIVEYKAPSVEITQQTFDQICRYNMRLRVRWLVVSNGLQHYCCSIDYDQVTYSFISEVPCYGELENAQ